MTALEERLIACAAYARHVRREQAGQGVDAQSIECVLSA